MNVTVRLFAMYRDEVGKKSLTMAVPAESTVREVLQRLETAHQGLSERLLTPNGKTKPAVTVLLNGRHLPEECGLETLLSEDDTLGVMPPITGGSGSGGRSFGLPGYDHDDNPA